MQLINGTGASGDTPFSFFFNTHTTSVDNHGGVVFSGVINASFPPPASSKDFTEEIATDLSTRYSSPAAVFGVLITFSLCTIFGNTLVITAVVREHSLKSPANYFVASLAAADFSVGVLLIPFEAITQLLNRRWIFGDVWCDLWHSFDVLLSTASILNLCVISLDRYWAICTPLSYPSRMNSKRAYWFITLVWILAVVISLPAIFWWRGVRHDEVKPGTCPFTDDVGYVISSSCISFYIPLAVMLFVYYKIYLAAVKQSKSIKQGAKLFSTPENLTLRMHRGRGNVASCSSDITATGNGVVGPLLSQHRKSFSFGDCRSAGEDTSGNGNQQNGTSLLNVEPHHKRTISEKIHRNRPSFFKRLHKQATGSVQGIQQDFASEVSTSSAEVFSTSSVDGQVPTNHHRAHHNGLMSFRYGTRRSFTVARKLARFAKEKKAAKTLGVVLGVFIICWVRFNKIFIFKEEHAIHNFLISASDLQLPFFLLNILFAICRTCAVKHEILYEVATWLGWINSAMNPVIYASWSHDFRR